MVFQVIVLRSRRGIACGGVRVEFIARQDMHATPVIERNTETGTIRIATPEATALEIVGSHVTAFGDFGLRFEVRGRRGEVVARDGRIEVYRESARGTGLLNFVGYFDDLTRTHPRVTEAVHPYAASLAGRFLGCRAA